MLYTINVFLQILLLNAFLGAKGKFYGIEVSILNHNALNNLVKVLTDIMNGREWTESGNFPRITLASVSWSMSLISSF